MKTYVCECERYDNGREIVAAFSSLDRAQEMMRVNLDGYSESNPKAEINWYSGHGGKWGWWMYAGDGFYVTEVDLRLDAMRRILTSTELCAEAMVNEISEIVFSDENK